MQNELKNVTPFAAPIRTIPANPVAADAVDRMDFSNAPMNVVDLPED